MATAADFYRVLGLIDEDYRACPLLIDPRIKACTPIKAAYLLWDRELYQIWLSDRLLPSEGQQGREARKRVLEVIWEDRDE